MITCATGARACRSIWPGYTFPLGVYAVATFKLGATLHLGFFEVVGTC